MFNCDFLDIEDTTINDSVADATAINYSIDEGLNEAASDFGYESFYDAQPVMTLPRSTVSETIAKTIVNPFKSKTGNRRIQLLKLRKQLTTLRTRTDCYYNIYGVAA